MIRNIVGLLIDINDGKKTLEEIDSIFKSKDRCSLGVSVPGTGLYLNNIKYWHKKYLCIKLKKEMIVCTFITL